MHLSVGDMKLFRNKATGGSILYDKVSRWTSPVLFIFFIYLEPLHNYGATEEHLPICRKPDK